MEKTEFGGDNPSARFGHTITPIGKDKAILFGGAVGDTGTLLTIKESMSSLETPFSATLSSKNGKNSTAKATRPPTEQPTGLYPSTTSSTSLEEPSEEEN